MVLKVLIFEIYLPLAFYSQEMFNDLFLPGKIDHVCILGIELGLACNGGSCGGIY